mgnify:CR=1 FL=1
MRVMQMKEKQCVLIINVHYCVFYCYYLRNQFLFMSKILL